MQHWQSRQDTGSPSVRVSQRQRGCSAARCVCLFGRNSDRVWPPRQRNRGGSQQAEQLPEERTLESIVVGERVRTPGSRPRREDGEHRFDLHRFVQKERQDVYRLTDFSYLTNKTPPGMPEDSEFLRRHQQQACGPREGQQTRRGIGSASEGEARCGGEGNPATGPERRAAATATWSI